MTTSTWRGGWICTSTSTSTSLTIMFLNGTIVVLPPSKTSSISSIPPSKCFSEMRNDGTSRSHIQSYRTADRRCLWQLDSDQLRRHGSVPQSYVLVPLHLRKRRLCP